MNVGRHYETVSFLSDYGTDDEFVGVVHSVVRSIAPHVTIIDITHSVPLEEHGQAGMMPERTWKLSKG